MSIKEHPIPFSADMIRALIWEYRQPGHHKNQTRRTRGLEHFNNFPQILTERGWEILEFTEEEPGEWLALSNDESGEFPDIFDPWVKCPYGKKGDRLWVRETFFETYNDQFKATGKYCYAATHQGFVSVLDEDGGIKINKDGSDTSPWKSSTQMPRRAARILLEITEIRIERLRQIAWTDARREGIEHITVDEYDFLGLWRDYTGKSTGFTSERDSFFSLWEKTKGLGSVELNPWVWVIKFKVLTINGKLNENNG